MSHVKLNTTYFTYYTAQHSGMPATGNPDDRYLVFEENGALPMLTGEMTLLADFSGCYRISLPILSSSGFDAGKYYSLSVSGVTSGVQRREPIRNFYVEENSFDQLLPLGTGLYHAQIDYCRLAPSGRDQYTVLWYHNTTYVPLSGLTSGFLQVYQATGNDWGIYVPRTGLVPFSPISGGKVDVTGSLYLLNTGERYVAESLLYVGTTQYLFRKHVGRDTP